MNKWEYRIIKVHLKDDVLTVDDLNKLGNECWELVSILYHKDNHGHYYMIEYTFKRVTF